MKRLNGIQPPAASIAAPMKRARAADVVVKLFAKAHRCISCERHQEKSRERNVPTSKHEKHERQAQPSEREQEHGRSDGKRRDDIVGIFGESDRQITRQAIGRIMQERARRRHRPETDEKKRLPDEMLYDRRP